MVSLFNLRTLKVMENLYSFRIQVINLNQLL